MIKLENIYVLQVKETLRRIKYRVLKNWWLTIKHGKEINGERDMISFIPIQYIDWCRVLFKISLKIIVGFNQMSLLENIDFDTFHIVILLNKSLIFCSRHLLKSWFRPKLLQNQVLGSFQLEKPRFWAISSFSVLYLGSRVTFELIMKTHKLRSL